MDVSYAQRLHAIGQLIDRAQLRQVCITETAEGVVVIGLVEEGRHTADLVLTPMTLTITNDEIARLLAETRTRRGPRLFGR